MYLLPGFSSFFLKRPVLTNIQVNFFPIAFDNNFATTLLSTPPDNAQITFEFPTRFLTSFISFFFWSIEDQFLFNFTNRKYKIFQYLFSFIGMTNLWVKLNTKKFFF